MKTGAAAPVFFRRKEGLQSDSFARQLVMSYEQRYGVSGSQPDEHHPQRLPNRIGWTNRQTGAMVRNGARQLPWWSTGHRGPAELIEVWSVQCGLAATLVSRKVA
jgi:hypothetical protein